MKFKLLLVIITLILTRTISANDDIYKSYPSLSLNKITSDYETRSFDDLGLKEFLEQNLKQEIDCTFCQRELSTLLVFITSSGLLDQSDAVRYLLLKVDLR